MFAGAGAVLSLFARTGVARARCARAGAALSLCRRAALALAATGLLLAGPPAAGADADGGGHGHAGAAANAGAEGHAGAGDYMSGEVVVGFEDGSSRVLDLPARTPVTSAARALERSPAVEFAAPNWIARTALTPLDQGTRGEPAGWQQDQWSFLAGPGGIRVGRGWDRALAADLPGGAGTTVAVVDTGVAYTAAPNGFKAAPDFDATQFTAGIDLVDGDELPLDENGHGTHVAGTIAEQVTLGAPAEGDDYLTGIAYGASLMPVRVLDRAGLGSATNVGAGILWAARHGADVINVSLQFDDSVERCADVPTVCKATRKARKLGALVIAAAGNATRGRGQPTALYPAAAPGVLAVGATTEHGCLAVYSHFKHATDLLAPGGGPPRPAAARTACAHDRRSILQLTLGCFPGSCAGEFSRFAIRADVGTSMAAAHASGVAALVRATRFAGRNPSAAKLGRRLKCTARSGSPRRFYGPGTLDAGRATHPRRGCS
jgi:serine protease